MRVLGKPAGITVLLLDGLKGWAAVALLARWVLVAMLPGDISAAAREAGLVTGGVAAVLGHNYTCWLKFKGGKGIATTAGVYVVLAPWALLIAFGVFLLGVVTTRYVSVGSIAAAVALPVAAGFTQPSVAVDGVTAALGALAVYKHRGNIARLRAGTENRLGQKKQEGA